MERREEVYDLVRAVRNKHLPRSKEIIRETVGELGLHRHPPAHIRGHFNSLLRQVFERALVVLERHEEEVYARRILSRLVELRGQELSARLPLSGLNDVAETLGVLYEDLWHIMHSRSQSRKGRGGSDYQEAIAELLRLSGIPFEQEKRPYRVDFYLPSLQFFDRNRTRAILLSAKRTLRERWREVVEELYSTGAPYVYLPTSEEATAITEDKLKDISKHNVRLLVWDEAKEKFASNQDIIGWSEFIRDEIPLLEERWTE